MTQLYSNLAHVYHDMYQHIFDYDDEYNFYNSILKKHNCHKILEIGCGSGMLARCFLKDGYDYLGLDLHNEMLSVAKEEIKSDCFVQGDMRKLSFNQEFDAILITGCSISYIIHNLEIMNTLKGIYNALKNNGIFIFDSFEAHGIFNNMKDFNQDIQHGDKRIQRINKLEKNLETGWTWDWKAQYIIEYQDEVSEYNDLTTLRAFTKDEIKLFLKMANLKVIDVIDEQSAMTLITKRN